MLAYLCELSRARTRRSGNRYLGEMPRSFSRQRSRPRVIRDIFSPFLPFFLPLSSFSSPSLFFAAFPVAPRAESQRGGCARNFKLIFTRTSFWDYSVVMVLFGVCRALASAGEGKSGKFRDEDPLSGIINFEFRSWISLLGN